MREAITTRLPRKSAQPSSSTKRTGRQQSNLANQFGRVAAVVQLRPGDVNQLPALLRRSDRSRGRPVRLQPHKCNPKGQLKTAQTIARS